MTGARVSSAQITRSASARTRGTVVVVVSPPAAVVVVSAGAVVVVSAGASVVVDASVVVVSPLSEELQAATTMANANIRASQMVRLVLKRILLSYCNGWGPAVDGSTLTANVTVYIPEM
jgi:hypothetical protein